MKSLHRNSAWMVAAVFLLSGCAVVEAIVDGLVTVGRQFQDQPAAYVTRVTGNDESGHRYLIDRLRIAENRSGRASGVRYEGLREAHVQIPDAIFPGEFQELSLRGDALRLAAIAEERIDVAEYYILITDTARDRLVLSTTALGFEGDIIRACGATDQAETELRFFFGEAFPDVDPSTVDVTWIPGGRRFGSATVFFGGWTQTGDAIFEQILSFEAETRVDGTLLSPPRGGRWEIEGGYQRVQVSADTGRILNCTPAPRVSLPDPRYELDPDTTTARTTGFIISPMPTESFPLYGLTGGSSRNRLFLSGQIDIVVPPY